MKAAAVTVCLLWLLLLLVFSTPASSPSTFLVPHAEATANSWTSKAPMHQARYGLGVAVVNGKIYAVGGSTWRGLASDVGGVVGTNEEYDPATDTWETKASMPTARWALQANVVNDKIYLIGGQFKNGSITGINEVYDPETDSWTTKTPMPNKASGASAVVDGKIYVIGRLSEGWNSTLNQIYDPETDTWSQGAPLPAGTHGVAGATTGLNAPKRIYVLGQDYSFLEPPYINGVYDPQRDRWTFGEPIPTERDGFGVAVVNDMLYVIGGFTETYTIPFDWSSSLITPYATNEQYTPFGYGTVPPKISVFSPENKTYTVNNVPLAVTVNKPAVWMGYSLDGQANVTIAENTTLSGLSLGEHSLTVYANDTFGNTGTSETIYFSIAQQSNPFPTTWIVATTAITAIGVVAILVYFAKIKKTTGKVEKIMLEGLM